MSSYRNYQPRSSSRYRDGMTGYEDPEPRFSSGYRDGMTGYKDTEPRFSSGFRYGMTGYKNTEPRFSSGFSYGMTGYKNTEPRSSSRYRDGMLGYEDPEPRPPYEYMFGMTGYKDPEPRPPYEYMFGMTGYKDPESRSPYEYKFGMTRYEDPEPRSSSRYRDGMTGYKNTAMDEAYLNTERRIVLLGRTGSGKSATGNAILGKTCFKSQVSASSVTSQCKLGYSSRFGKSIITVDTPGLFDTGMSNDLVLKEVIKCVGMTAPGPHALLFVIGVGRFTQEEEDTISKLIELFGEGVLKYVIVVFTFTDNLEHEGVSIQEYVRTVPDSLKRVLQKCGNRFIGFNNRASPDEKDDQVKGLLKEIDKMIRNNGGRFYSNDMYVEAEKAVQRRMREIHDKHNREKEEAERKYNELLREQEIYRKEAQREKSKHEKMRLENKQKELELKKERLARIREQEKHEEDLERQRQQARTEIEREEPGVFRMIVSGVKQFASGIWKGIKNIFS